MGRKDEAWRHECEVRQALRWRAERGGVWLDGWMAAVAEKRGREAAIRIRRDVVEQWRLGNRGEAGRWDKDKN